VTRYRIAPERSQVWIDAKSTLHPIHSVADGLEGFVDVDLEPDGGLDLSVMPKGTLSFPVDRLSSGNRMEDRELHKRIDARRYPIIEGTLGSVVPDGEAGSYRVGGEITFRGVSRHHEDVMHIRGVDPGTIRLDGATQFDIREFGMEPPRMLLLRVEPEVAIRVDIIAVEET
jgi:polyisoprenoid-binding protein YceI